MGARFYFPYNSLMFKINKSMWITSIIYLVLETLIFFLLKFGAIKTSYSNSIYLPIMITPLIIIVILWIVGKIRKSKIKNRKVEGLTPRDVELAHFYANQKDIKEISFDELGQIWFRNSLSYYLASFIVFAVGFILYAALEWI